MNALVALGLVFLIYSIGDFIADKTKAFVSMLLACHLYGRVLAGPAQDDFCRFRPHRLCQDYPLHVSHPYRYGHQNQ